MACFVERAIRHRSADAMEEIMPSFNEEHPFGWDGKVATSTAGGGFSYVPNRALIPSGSSISLDDFVAPGEQLVLGDGSIARWQAVSGSFDVVRLVAHLRSMGVPAQPDHVLSAHADCDCWCDDHPADLRSNPFRSNPFRSNPFRSNPFRSNPFRSNSTDAELPTRSSARPSAAPQSSPVVIASSVNPRVAVIDTGLAGLNLSVQNRPALLSAVHPGSVLPYIEGELDSPDIDSDGWLDPVAGHGTFIAGLIEQYARGCPVTVHRAVQSRGQADESLITSLVELEANKAVADRPAFLNLSFGGYIWDKASMIESAIYKAQAAGIVVVASAGNDGSCRPTYPAAFPGVVSVGALGPDGPSWFTNYGPWVTASAPGEDLVSSFFDNWNGKNPQMLGGDPDDFHGWAVWSGTSFAAPMVVAALVREMRRTGCTNKQAVEQIIDAPHLARLRGLGTIVNV
jgi:hypothetical protein